MITCQNKCQNHACVQMIFLKSFFLEGKEAKASWKKSDIMDDHEHLGQLGVVLGASCCGTLSHQLWRQLQWEMVSRSYLWTGKLVFRLDSGRFYLYFHKNSERCSLYFTGCQERYSNRWAWVGVWISAMTARVMKHEDFSGWSSW